jgi:hypothetical protein
MPLWGANTSDESKPKNLTAEEKSRVFADARGWVITRPDGNEEVLVAIRNLSGGSTTSVKLGIATISQVFFRAASFSTGATGIVRVVWNEKIVPTTTGTLTVTATASDGTSVSTITATRTGNATARNFVDFAFTAPSTTGSVLSITSQTITMGINDAGTTVTSDLTIALVDIDAAALTKGGSLTAVTTA